MFEQILAKINEYKEGHNEHLTAADKKFEILTKINLAQIYQKLNLKQIYKSKAKAIY